MIGLIPGTFDPPTLGHLEIIQRAATLCKKLYIGVADNASKTPSFTQNERMSFLGEICHHLPNVEIVSIHGLVIDFVKKQKIDTLVRGLRSFSDMEHETQMAQANKKLGGVETLFLISEGHFAHISSSLIREIAACGHHLKDFVPKEIEEKVFSRLKKS